MKGQFQQSAVISHCCFLYNLLVEFNNYSVALIICSYRVLEREDEKILLTLIGELIFFFF